MEARNGWYFTDHHQWTHIFFLFADDICTHFVNLGIRMGIGMGFYPNMETNTRQRNTVELVSNVSQITKHGSPASFYPYQKEFANQQVDLRHVIDFIKNSVKPVWVVGDLFMDHNEVVDSILALEEFSKNSSNTGKFSYGDADLVVELLKALASEDDREEALSILALAFGDNKVNRGVPMKGVL